MNFLGLLFLLVAHYLSGRGVIYLFRVKLAPAVSACLSLIIGVAVLSFVPCILQLLHVPLTSLSVSAGITVVTVVLSIGPIRNFKRPLFGKVGLPKVYELPFLFIILLLVIISVWRCFYYPPTARDLITGPELLAEYAVREHTMISSVFSIDMSTTNNHFKSPYITSLQIIYKLLVCPFGQVWLSILFMSFTVWLYSIVRSSLHPLLAGFLMLLFTIMPDLYAYTYLVLYDYSNMLFFFAGFYFLSLYGEHKKTNEFIFSAFLFGIATYVRTETLVLVILLTPLVVFYFRKEALVFKQRVLRLGIFLMIPAAFYFLCIQVFIRNFVPLPFDLSANVNSDLGDFAPFFQRLYDMFSELLLSGYGLTVYGYFVYFFFVLLVADLIIVRRFNREARVALFGVAVILFGLPLLGYLLPLMDLLNSTKRGLFKILPLMLLYMCNSGLLLRLSNFLKKREAASLQVHDGLMQKV